MRLGLSCGMLHGRALTCFFLRRRIIMVYFNIFAKGVKINVQWRLQQIHRTSINLIAHELDFYFRYWCTQQIRWYANHACCQPMNFWISTGLHCDWLSIKTRFNCSAAKRLMHRKYMFVFKLCVCTVYIYYGYINTQSCIH